MAGFRAAGVTRISFGVQSASDAQLRRLGRTHTAARAAQALAWARAAGFEEICGDIMLALPEYSNAEFDRYACLAAGRRLHAYFGLPIKGRAGHGVLPQPARGPAGRRRGGGLLSICGGRSWKRPGYRQYEISNFCPPRP